MDDSDFDDDALRRPSQRQNSNRRFIPIEFAKQHILKIEEDMKKMHDRHVKLMREMDENYRLIETETQEYYIEFLQKWKELAKNKIARYRQQCDDLVAEKMQIVRNKDTHIDSLNDRVSGLLREKEKFMREYSESLSLREAEHEASVIA
jgi:hypothetical protein